MSLLTRRGRLADRTVIARVAALMVVEAATLAVASALHLSGSVQGRSAPFNAGHAGVAEAIIGGVLAAGAVVMFRPPAPGRSTTGFAIAGFLVGLNFTARGGHLPDIAYHITMSPVLIGSLIVLVRVGPSARAGSKG